MRFRIRNANLSDLKVLGTLWEEWMRIAAADFETPLLPDAGDFFSNMTGTGILTGAYIVFVAETEGIDGFILGQVMTPEPPFHPVPYGYINYLYVAPHARGRGLGKALVQSLMAAFAGRGLSRVELHVYASNTTGRSFWEAMGMHPLGLRMSCSLDNGENNACEENHE